MSISSRTVGWRRLAVALLGLMSFCILAAAGAVALQIWPNPLAAPPEPVIRFGVVWPTTANDGFIKGARLAQGDVNAAGGVMGQQLELEIVGTDPESPTLERGARIARGLAGKDNLVAVIGHSDSSAAVTASITYQDRGILYVNTTVTDDSVNKHNYFNVFSTVPNNEGIGNQLATFAEGLGLRRIGILSVREDFAFQTAESFLQQSVALGLRIPIRRSFYPGRATFLDVIAEFGAHDLDALLVIAATEAVPVIIRQARIMQLDTTILVGTLQDVDRLAESIQDTVGPVVVPVLYNPGSGDDRAQDFRARYQAEFGEPPDGWAAQSYDAVRLIADTMVAAASDEALSVAVIFRHTLAWRGVTGRHSFDRFGRIYTKRLNFATIDAEVVRYSSSGGG